MSDAPGTRAGVLCAGSMLVDLGKEIDAYPPLDGLAMIERVSQSTGGAALNMAVDLRLLGAAFPVELLGAVGDDEHAAHVLAECARLGVGTAGVRTLEGTATSFTDVMVERDTGRRTFFHYAGANDAFDASTAELGGSRARILHAGAPGVLASMDAPVAGGGNGWTALLRRARAAGMHTNLELASLGPERMAEVVLPCLAHVDSLVINELEAGALTGGEASLARVDDAVDWPAVEAMALALVELGVSALAVVHFPAGCVAAAPGGRTWRQGSVRVPPEEVRSATGAGDALAAGVVLGLHEGWPVERCLRLGVAAAAACVRSPTTSGGILAADECLAAADAAGYRAVAPAGTDRVGGARTP
jgi:sugar/nucleoside kinase (ribokinase family)